MVVKREAVEDDEARAASSPKKLKKNKNKLSEEDFVKMYEEFLSSARGNFARKNTVKDYSRQLKTFIKMESEVNPDFRPRHWLAFGSSNFKPLGDVAEYMPQGTGKSLGTHKVIEKGWVFFSKFKRLMVFSKLQVCAFKHLLRMIRKELVKVRGLYPHWADRMAHLNVRENEASATGREIKRGRGGESLPDPVSQPPRVSSNGWRRLLKAYLKSSRREEILQQLSGMVSHKIQHCCISLIFLS